MSDVIGSQNSSPVKRSDCTLPGYSPYRHHHFLGDGSHNRSLERHTPATNNMVCDNSVNSKTVNFDEGVCLTSTPTLGRSSRCSSRSASTTASDTVSTPDLENGFSDCGISETGVYNRSGQDVIKPEYNVPIVGYEVMEERARFTVFRIHVENVRTRQSWFVFRRYTDFVRLNRKLKLLFPGLRFSLPPKRWFGNNFDPVFLEDRLLGLQAYINNIISHKDISHSEPVRMFFCFDDPPDPHDSIEESRALCESLEDTVHRLQEELKEKDSQVQILLAEVAMLRSQQETLLKSLKLECTLTAHALNPKHPSQTPSKEHEDSHTCHSLTEIRKDPVDSHLFHMHSLNLALAHMVERSMSDVQSASSTGSRNNLDDSTLHLRQRLIAKRDEPSRNHESRNSVDPSLGGSTEDLLERSTGDGCMWVGERPTPLGGAGCTPPLIENGDGNVETPSAQLDHIKSSDFATCKVLDVPLTDVPNNVNSVCQ